MSIFSAVQHERAPRTYSKKPSYFSDFSAIAAGAAAVAAASNHHQIAPGSIHSGARPPLLNPLGIPHGMHPYYPLHHFKSFFPALFPHATSGEFIYSKIGFIILIFVSVKIIRLGKQLMINQFLITSFFEVIHFLKLGPIFVAS